MSAGMLPYRLGLPIIDMLPAADGDWNEVMRRIRAAL